MCLTESKEGVLVSVKVIPNASRNKVMYVKDGNLVVKVSSPPLDGKANKSLVQVLSSFFDVKKKDVLLLKGEKSRKKQVLIKGIDKEKASKAILSM